MFDPLTLLVAGAGFLTFRELNRKDYGVLTPSRDERYRTVMEYCMEPTVLLEESKLFAEYGLKAQAAMLRRRSEWRARSPAVKEQHENIYKKALESTNIAAILQAAQAFEGWTATKKAAALRARADELQQSVIQDNIAAVVQEKEPAVELDEA